jgi:dTDP-4-amino-4,6-dideoxygalactose transaminase
MIGNSDKILHVGSPQMGDINTFLSYVSGVYERNWWTNNGELVQEFEKKVEDLLHVKHCVAIVNGTIALQIAAKACEIKGDIVVPAFTFPATAYAFLWTGYNVHLCDIDPETHQIDYGLLDTYLEKNPQIKGIVPVHVWGEICDTDMLSRIAKKHGCTLIYDAAHAFLCANRDGKYVGTNQACEVFSFHATKFFSTIEGGAIATNDDEIAGKARLLRNFGFAGTDDVRICGTNGKMHEITAAMGLTNLALIHRIRAACMRNYSTYKSVFDSFLPGIVLRNVLDREQSWIGRNYQYVVVEIDQEITGVTRDQILESLVSHQVLARRYFWPGCHRLPPFDKMNLSMPTTDKVAARTLCLPTGASVSDEDIYRVCHIIEKALRSKL